MKKEMLINVLQPEECRIAILEDGVLEELYVERTSHESYVGNIYKGRIVNIEPSIQAAFVDFGVGRNGFLHVSDVEPAYYRHLMSNGDRDSGRGRRGGGRGGRGRGERRPPRELDEDLGPPSYEAADEVAVVDDEHAIWPEFDETTLPDEIETEPAASADEMNEFGETEAVALAEEDVETESPPEPKPSSRRKSAVTAEPAEVTSEVEPPGEADPPKRRKRGNNARGRSRRGKKEAPENKEELNDEKPFPMDSAERRTDEDDEGSQSLGAADTFTDADLSFSQVRARSEPESRSTPAVAEPQPLDDFDEEPSPEAFDEESGSVDFEEEAVPSPQLDPEEEFVEELHEERLSAFEEDELEPRRPRRRDDRRGDRRGGGPRGRRMGGRPGGGRPKPLIQDIFRRGQEVLVQVIKEGIGTKGPTLSTYISIAGRYLVLMPGLNRIGVSRKIVDEEQRRRLREILGELEPPKGLGFIIRTAGLDRTKKELQRDLAYLSRLWQVVVRRIRKIKAPAEIYQESDMITRTIRDCFTGEIDTIYVDEPGAFEHAQEFLQVVMPRYAERIKLYTEPQPMFHRYGIEDEIIRIQQRHVPLPNGGSIVIDQTEALVAIDVNSGNFRADNNAEETAYQMNLLAAKEIARQLRLRDLGGVIVNDFIDMKEEKHRRSVERAMREAVKRDRARTKILKISQFGIIEMTRQRIRPSLKRSVYQDCPHCGSTGQVKTVESMSIDVMRLLQLAAHKERVQRIQVRVHDEVANYLQNRKRKEIAKLEETATIQVMVLGTAGVSPEFLEFLCFDNNDNETRFLPYEETKPRRRGRD